MRVVVHLSDIHFGRVDLTTIGPLTEAIFRASPHLIAVSGDLTQRARRREFAAARVFLDNLTFPQLVVPGNHDVPLYNVFSRFVTPLARYRRAISDNLAPVYRDDEMIAVGVNTARSWTWGEGRINEGQVDELVTHLAAVPSDLIRIVVTHHPFDLPEGVEEARLLGRAEMAMKKLSVAGADLFLAGHLHISHVGHAGERYDLGNHSALVVQAGTLSIRSRGEEPSFNILRIHRPYISVERMVWNSSRGGYDEAGEARYRHSERGWVLH
jgi:3',5'-cyclic AMP phosphodiesterase CpdA